MQFTQPAQDSRRTKGLEPPDTPPLDGACLPAKRRDEKALELCECVIDIAAALFNVSGRDIRRSGRATTGVTRVRQVAMYVAHVVLRLSMSDIGRGFGRDRTTVVYACHLIEDMRDDREFDRVIAMVEGVAKAAIRGREAIR